MKCYLNYLVVLCFASLLFMGCEEPEALSEQISFTYRIEIDVDNAGLSDSLGEAKLVEAGADLIDIYVSKDGARRLFEIQGVALSGDAGSVRIYHEGPASFVYRGRGYEEYIKVSGWVRIPKRVQGCHPPGAGYLIDLTVEFDKPAEEGGGDSVPVCISILSDDSY